MCLVEPISKFSKKFQRFFFHRLCGSVFWDKIDFFLLFCPAGGTLVVKQQEENIAERQICVRARTTLDFTFLNQKIGKMCVLYLPDWALEPRHAGVVLRELYSMLSQLPRSLSPSPAWTKTAIYIFIKWTIFQKKYSTVSPQIRLNFELYKTFMVFCQV